MMAEHAMQKHMNADSVDVETNPVLNRDKQLPKDTMEHVTIGDDDVRDDDNLDAEVRACLEGFPSYTSNKSSSPSSCSFYSSCTLPGRESEVDSMSSYSYYSTGTVRDTDTDTASYCSVDTMVGDTDGEEEREEVDVTRSVVNENCFVQQVNLGNTVDREGLSDITRDDNPYYREHQEEISKHCDPHSDTLAPQSYPTGSCLSENTGSAGSSVSEGEVSFAGQVNDRLGRLLGYDGEEAQNVDVDAAIAKIMGYEIVGTEKDRFTVYKICVSHPSSVFGAWFIHWRYSDFLRLRTTLIKEHPSRESQLPFPPKRWVGSNLEATFIGRRLAGLQFFLATILEIRELKSSQVLQSFLCLNKPMSGQPCLQDNKVICDTLEEAIKELRKQLRKKEKLDMELSYHKEMNIEKEQQIKNLMKENLMLRQQKDVLVNSKKSRRPSSHSDSGER